MAPFTFTFPPSPFTLSFRATALITTLCPHSITSCWAFAGYRAAVSSGHLGSRSPLASCCSSAPTCFTHFRRTMALWYGRHFLPPSLAYSVPLITAALPHPLSPRHLYYVTTSPFRLTDPRPNCSFPGPRRTRAPAVPTSPSLPYHLPFVQYRRFGISPVFAMRLPHPLFSYLTTATSSLVNSQSASCFPPSPLRLT